MFDSTGDQSQDKEARPCLESRRAQMSHTLCDLIKDGIAIHCIVCRLRFVAMGLSRVGRVGLLVQCVISCPVGSHCETVGNQEALAKVLLTSLLQCICTCEGGSKVIVTATLSKGCQHVKRMPKTTTANLAPTYL